MSNEAILNFDSRVTIYFDILKSTNQLRDGHSTHRAKSCQLGENYKNSAPPFYACDSSVFTSE